MRERYSAELAQLQAKAPPLTPDQVREIRAIWLGIISRQDQPPRR